VSFCLAISALYELFEWLVAMVSRDDAVSFLATQGDVWDTQKDMALCLLGAVVSLLALGRLHNRSLEKIKSFEG
jgi:putative membrane protein